MSPIPPASDEPLLSIGDLAERSGVSSGTVRIWETRHGFPEPIRRESGHRRYRAVDVESVREVARLRDAGVRLDAAIAQVRGGAVPGAATGSDPETDDSVFARLRRAYPALQPTVLSKRTLIAMSWAIEDELSAHARPAHLFGAFQRQRHYDAARERWSDLARQTRSAFVFADFDGASADRPVEVPLPESAPMLREWSVVCDATGLSVALAARERLGQRRVADADRVFECLWTFDPAPVRDAARTCAGLALATGVEEAREPVEQLASSPLARPDLAALTSLVNRSYAYVDRAR